MSLLNESEFRLVSGREDLPFHSPDTQKIVFHGHSTESDGLLTPEEIAGFAKDAGISYVGFADHDTMRAHASLTDSGIIQTILAEEVTTYDLRENGGIRHIGALLRHEITIPYRLPFRETVRMINQAGHVFIPHIEMDKYSVTWQQVKEQNESNDPLDHIRLIETTNGADLKKTERVTAHPLWGVIFKQSGSSERAREYAKQHKERLGIQEIGGGDWHFNDIFDVVMVMPNGIDPIDAMVDGMTAVFERNKQSSITLRDFLKQRKKAHALEERRLRNMV